MNAEPTPDRTDGGYDVRVRYCPPLDSREQMRRDNLADAERIILGKPAIAAVIREVSDKWSNALSKLAEEERIRQGWISALKIYNRTPDQPPCHDWPATDPLPTTDPED
jgi:hypothetical protein